MRPLRHSEPSPSEATNHVRAVRDTIPGPPMIEAEVVESEPPPSGVRLVGASARAHGRSFADWLEAAANEVPPPAVCDAE